MKSVQVRVHVKVRDDAVADRMISSLLAPGRRQFVDAAWAIGTLEGIDVVDSREWIAAETKDFDRAVGQYVSTRLLSVMRDLRTDDGDDNPEYDRALAEVYCDMRGWPTDCKDVATTLIRGLITLDEAETSVLEMTT